MNRHWMRVFCAAFFEVIWVIGLAYAYDMLTWTGTIIALIISNYLMITAAQVLPAGTVYSVFVGLGTAGTVAVDILFFGEPLRWIKLVLIFLLLTGIIGLKLVTDQTEKGES